MGRAEREPGRAERAGCEHEEPEVAVGELEGLQNARERSGVAAHEGDEEKTIDEPSPQVSGPAAQPGQDASFVLERGVDRGEGPLGIEAR